MEEVLSEEGLTVLRRTEVRFPWESSVDNGSEQDSSEDEVDNLSRHLSTTEESETLTPPPYIRALVSLYYPHLLDNIADTSEPNNPHILIGTPHTPEINNMADYSMISEFSWRKGEKDAGRWLKNLEAIVKGNRAVLDYAKFVEVFDMKLTGPASDWANVTPEVFKVIDKDTITEQDVIQLKQAFLFQFKTIRPEPIKATDELRDLFQEPAERVEMYYRRANRILCRMIPGKDFEDGAVIEALTSPEKIIMQQVVDKFMTALRDNLIEFQVWKESPTNLRDASKLALKEESYGRFWEKKNEDTARRGYAPVYVEAPLSPPLSSPTPSTPKRPETGNPVTGSVTGSPAKSPTSPTTSTVSENKQETPPPRQLYDSGRGGRQWGGRGGFGWQGYYSGNGGSSGSGTSGNSGSSGNNGGNAGAVTRPVYKPDGAMSLNHFITGEKKYDSKRDGPLCVECGVLGHVPRNCPGPPLATWERETLRRLIFKDSPNYYNS